MNNLFVLILSVLALVAVHELMAQASRRNPRPERGALGWDALLPNVGGVVQAAVGAGGYDPTTGRPDSSVISSAFNNKYVRLGARALGAYQAFTGAPVHPTFDISAADDPDDQEVAKMIAQYGAIPAASDIGQLAVNAGARVYKQRVAFSDGSSAVIDVVQVGSRRGGADRPEGREVRRRKNLTSYRLGTAAWVVRKLHAQQRLGRKLASMAKQLYPSPRPASRKRR